MQPPIPRLDRLRDLVSALGELTSRDIGETVLLEGTATLVAALVSHDDWLPPTYGEPDPAGYRQYLLHCDSEERFCIVSFVWMPGQSTPVHDHGVWGVVGILRGTELSQSYRIADGRLETYGDPLRLQPGDVEKLSPTAGDIHHVVNGSDCEVAISIHVYGGNIGRITRRKFAEDGSVLPFVSAFSNETLPNIWI